MIHGSPPSRRSTPRIGKKYSGGTTRKGSPFLRCFCHGVSSFQQLSLDQQDGAPEVVHSLLEALDGRRHGAVAFLGDDRPCAFAPIAVADDGCLAAVDHGEAERDPSSDVRTRPVYREVAHCSSSGDRNASPVPAVNHGDVPAVPRCVGVRPSWSHQCSMVRRATVLPMRNCSSRGRSWYRPQQVHTAWTATWNTSSASSPHVRA